MSLTITENFVQQTPLYIVNASLLCPGVRFSKAPETFRALKAIFTSAVSKNGEAYAVELLV